MESNIEYGSLDFCMESNLEYGILYRFVWNLTLSMELYGSLDFWYGNYEFCMGLCIIGPW